MGSGRNFQPRGDPWCGGGCVRPAAAERGLPDLSDPPPSRGAGPEVTVNGEGTKSSLLRVVCGDERAGRSSICLQAADPVSEGSFPEHGHRAMDCLRGLWEDRGCPRELWGAELTPGRYPGSQAHAAASPPNPASPAWGGFKTFRTVSGFLAAHPAVAGQALPQRPPPQRSPGSLDVSWAGSGRLPSPSLSFPPTRRHEQHGSPVGAMCACVRVCACPRGHTDVAVAVAQQGQTRLGAGEPGVRNSHDRRRSVIRNHATAMTAPCPSGVGALHV